MTPKDRLRLLAEIEDLLDDEPQSPLRHLSEQALEALHRLIEADGRPVPGDRLCHQVATGVFRQPGDWSAPGVAASVVSQLRSVLGHGAVLTVRGHGYVLGALPEELL